MNDTDPGLPRTLEALDDLIAERDRLARNLSAEEGRRHGWQRRALEDEKTLIDVRAELAQQKATNLRLLALLGQGLDLLDTWELDRPWEYERAEGMRRALTIAPGETAPAATS